MILISNTKLINNKKNKLKIKIMKQNPKTIIKCTFSNKVHKLLEPNLDVKNYQRWKHHKKLTDEEKIELFDKIYAEHNKCSNLLGSYGFEKRNKKRIHKARVERGYKFKKKTKKEDYEKSLVSSN